MPSEEELQMRRLAGRTSPSGYNPGAIPASGMLDTLTQSLVNNPAAATADRRAKRRGSGATSALYSLADLPTNQGGMGRGTLKARGGLRPLEQQDTVPTPAPAPAPIPVPAQAPIAADQAQPGQAQVIQAAPIAEPAPRRGLAFEGELPPPTESSPYAQSNEPRGLEGAQRIVNPDGTVTFNYQTGAGGGQASITGESGFRDAIRQEAGGAPGGGTFSVLGQGNALTDSYAQEARHERGMHQLRAGLPYEASVADVSDILQKRDLMKRSQAPVHPKLSLMDQVAAKANRASATRGLRALQVRDKIRSDMQANQARFGLQQQRLTLDQNTRAVNAQQKGRENQLRVAKLMQDAEQNRIANEKPFTLYGMEYDALGQPVTTRQSVTRDDQGEFKPIMLPAQQRKAALKRFEEALAVNPDNKEQIKTEMANFGLDPAEIGLE